MIFKWFILGHKEKLLNKGFSQGVFRPASVFFSLHFPFVCPDAAGAVVQAEGKACSGTIKL